MKKAIEIGTKIDFRNGSHYLKGGKVIDIDYPNRMIVVETIGCHHYIDFGDVRAIH
jgi:hypothetical protein